MPQPFFLNTAQDITLRLNESSIIAQVIQAEKGPGSSYLSD